MRDPGSTCRGVCSGSMVQDDRRPPSPTRQINGSAGRRLLADAGEVFPVLSATSYSPEHWQAGARASLYRPGFEIALGAGSSGSTATNATLLRVRLGRIGFGRAAGAVDSSRAGACTDCSMIS